MTWADLPPNFRHTAELILTDRQLTALKLHHGRLSYREIADHLDISVSTAYDTVSTAKRKIERALRQTA